MKKVEYILYLEMELVYCYKIPHQLEEGRRACSNIAGLKHPKRIGQFQHF